MIIIEKWSGRLGNNIIQIKNALHLALYNNDNVKIPNHYFFNTNIIEHTKEKNNTIIKDKYNFYYKERINVDKKIFNINHEKIKKILQMIVNITITKNQNIKISDTLIIHIRSGDIFSNNPHSKYIPPPFNYYKDIIEKNNYKNIQIICEDTKNPVVNKLLTIYPYITYKKQSLIEDIKIILQGENVVSSIGTFIPALLYISNNIRNIYNISYDDDFFYKFISYKDDNVNYYTSNYTDYYNKIKLWKNNIEQKNLLLNYNLNITT